MSKITLDREVITAKQAKEYLEANENNRNLRKQLVSSLAGAIERGEWVETGDPIKFNGTGLLVDGQHRLAAIAQSRKRVTAWVARGVPLEAQEVVDTGAKRTAGDMLKLRGYINCNHLASVARAVWAYRNHGEPMVEAGWVPPTAQQLLALINEEPALVERTAAGIAFGRQDQALRISGTTVGALLHIFAEKASEEDAQGFFAQVLSPASQSDPTAVLRRKLLQVSLHNPMTKRMQLALIVKAWNAWLVGEQPTRLTWRAGGATKEAFPEVREMHYEGA